MKKVINLIIALIICAGLWAACDYLIPNHIGPNLLEDVIGYHNDDYRFSLGIHDNLDPEKVTDRSYIVGTVLNDGKYPASDAEYKLSTENGGYVVAVERDDGAGFDVVREDATVGEATVFVPDEEGNIEFHHLQSQIYKFHNISRKSIRPVISPTVNIEFIDNYISENAGTINQKFTVKSNNITEGIRFDGESKWVVVVLGALMLCVLLVFMWPKKKVKKLEENDKSATSNEDNANDASKGSESDPNEPANAKFESTEDSKNNN